MYAELGDVASVYPVLEPHVHTSRQRAHRASARSAEPTPSGPATAGAQPRSPLSEGATVSASRSAPPPAWNRPRRRPLRGRRARRPRPPKPPAHVRVFSEGANDVFLHPLVPGVQVIAGTVLGHVGAGADASARREAARTSSSRSARPACGAPLIDPKPILDGWVALEEQLDLPGQGREPVPGDLADRRPGAARVQAAARAAGAARRRHPARRVRASGRAGGSGRQARARDARVPVGLGPEADRRRAALPPTRRRRERRQRRAAREQRVSRRSRPSTASRSPATRARARSPTTTVRKLLMLQGLARPQRIVSLMSYPGAAAARRQPRRRRRDPRRASRAARQRARARAGLQRPGSPQRAGSS